MVIRHALSGELIKFRPRASTPSQPLDAWLAAARSCRTGETQQPLGPQPVLRAQVCAHVLVEGFFQSGRGRGENRPPRRKCLPPWLNPLLAQLPQIHFRLLIGRQARRHFLGRRHKASLTLTLTQTATATATVKA